MTFASKFLKPATWAQAAVFSIILAGPAAADAWIFGLGINDFTELSNDDRVVVGVEYQTDPFSNWFGADMTFAFAADAHSNGDYWVGAGIAGVYPLQDRWFAEFSVMPGYYDYDSPTTDIGSEFEIRSLIGLGRQISDNTALSVAVTHKSNAGTSDTNPGLNAVMLRLRVSY